MDIGPTRQSGYRSTISRKPSLSAAPPDKAEGLRLRARLRYLYHGSRPPAVRFRLAVIAVDIAIIGFFLAAPILHEAGVVFYIVDYLVAAILALDLAARAYAHTDIKDWLKKPTTWVDLFILATLLVPVYNFGFLRMLRLWSLLNSDFFWRTVGRRYDDTRVEEIVRQACAQLLDASIDAPRFVRIGGGGEQGLGAAAATIIEWSRSRVEEALPAPPVP